MSSTGGRTFFTVRFTFFLTIFLPLDPLTTGTDEAGFDGLASQLDIIVAAMAIIAVNRNFIALDSI